MNDNGRAKNTLSNAVGQNRTGNKADDAAGKGQECSLSQKQGSDSGVPRAQRFHQSHFLTTFQDRGGHGGGNRERGSQKRRKREQQHKSGDARKNFSLVLFNLADLLHARVG